MLLALFALAEAAILAPILVFCVPLPMLDRPGVIGVVFLLLAALAGLWRWLGEREISARVQVLALGTVLVALTVIADVQLASIRSEFDLTLIWLLPGFVVAALLLWRGAALGQTDLTFTDASRRLQMGALALVVLGMVALVFPQNRLMESIVPFFIGAAFALPLSHLESVSRSIYGRTVTMTRAWWVWSVVITLLVALASVVLLSIMSGTPIAMILIGIFALLALPFVLLLSLLLPTLTNGSLPTFNLRLPSLAQLPQGEIQASIFDGLVIPPQFNLLIAVVILALIGGAVLLLLGVAQRSKRELKSVGPQADFDIARPEPGIDGLQKLRSSLDLRRWLAALTVRRLYARMVHEAAKRGQQRLPAQTPLDYLPHLNRAFPNAAQDVGAITDAYVAAHYGELPDDDAALARLREAWDRVRIS